MPETIIACLDTECIFNEHHVCLKKVVVMVKEEISPFSNIVRCSDKKERVKHA